LKVLVVMAVEAALLVLTPLIYRYPVALVAPLFMLDAL
jgi:hypothetical protein